MLVKQIFSVWAASSLVLLAVPGTILDADRGGRLLAAVVPVLQKDAAKLGEFLRSASADIRAASHPSAR